MSLKVQLLVVLCNCPLIAQIKAECIIETAQDVSVRPKFFRISETTPTLISDEYQKIRLDDNETIVGYCANQFVNAQESDTTIRVNCQDDEIHFITDGYNQSSFLFECVQGRPSGTCSILLAADKAVRPKIFKKIGTRITQLSSQMETIAIKYGQEISVQCDTKFKSPSYQTPELNLICIDGLIVALGHRHSDDYSTFECELYKWNVYESKTPFPWCPASMAAYILARPLADNGYQYLAGICYDIDRMSFKSLYHAAKPKFAKNLAPRILETFEPLMEITDIDENFISKRTYLYDNPRMLKWLFVSHYANSSIVQLPRLHIDLFQQFDQLLNIDWWNVLKLGNWGLYQEALAEYVDNENNDYDILAGISKVVAVPIRKNNCSKTITMVDVADSDNYKLPLYVWNYVRSLQNSSDEVVVIGVNTPFSDFYDEKELLFCNDICHTIDWLKDVHMTFPYRSMGIIFCCTFDEVLASMRLDGFAKPEAPIPSSLLPTILKHGAYVAKTTTVETVESTEYDETTESEQVSDEY